MLIIAIGIISLCAATILLRNVGTFLTTHSPSPYDYDLGNFSTSSDYLLGSSSQNYGEEDISLNTIDDTPINLSKKASTTTKALTTTKKTPTTTEALTTTEKASTTTETLTTTEKAPITTEETLTTTGKILITAVSSLIIVTITAALYTLKKYFYNLPEEPVLDMKELDFFIVNDEDNTVDLMAKTPIDDHLE
ncbi:hypothetical protein [Rickettsia endosymbiont of Oedothorax gibbosus]|uniref:hypothetical protein n=1 Tax=Rickettsia endosymbiont of Oedothorax gibbosus TaxID=931099 RepID=UPI0020243ABB|nr:hypothetical protein [Rickettsia endosymbiont of Oedothorax gibbosus]